MEMDLNWSLPDSLWFKGESDLQTWAGSPKVGIVGTRAADDNALAWTRELAGHLASLGVVVVSGGARGIDTAAHEGALQAGGVTWLVSAAGVDFPTPESQAQLFSQVQENGFIISEYDPTFAPAAWKFLERNRIIALLSDIVVVAQAPARSGAMATARRAQELGKPVFATPGRPQDPRHRGCNQLLKKGARVCFGADEILQQLDLLGPAQLNLSDPALPRPAPPPEIHPFLTHAPRTLEQLAHESEVPLPDVQTQVFQALLDGIAAEHPGGRYSLR